MTTPEMWLAITREICMTVGLLGGMYFFYKMFTSPLE